MSTWIRRRLEEIINFNPRESIAKGTLLKRIAMEKLEIFTRDINGYELSEFKGGTKFRNGDTLMARITPSLENGKTAKVSLLNHDEIGFGSTEFIVARNIEGISDSDFIYYLLLDNDIREIAIKSMVGSSGRQRVQLDVLKKHEILCPPINEQKIIGTILKSIDDKIQLNKQINHHLAEQAKSIYNNILETENTNSMKLKEIAHIVMGQSPKSSTYNNQGLGLPLLNGAADFRGKIQPSKYTSDPKKIVLGGEYIFGVRATIGLTTKVFHKYAIGRGTGAAKAINREYDEFLYFVLENLFKQFAESGSGTVYINISKSDFDNYEVLVPSLDKIMSFHQITKPIMELVYINEVENERLEKIRNTILPKLISGKITAF